MPKRVLKNQRSRKPFPPQSDSDEKDSIQDLFPVIESEGSSVHNVLHCKPNEARKLSTSCFSNLPTVYQTVKLAFIILVFMLIIEVYYGLVPIIRLPGEFVSYTSLAFPKLFSRVGFSGNVDFSWKSVENFFKTQVQSTNFTSDLRKTLEKLETLEPGTLASLSTSLQRASNILNDLPVATFDYPNREIEKESEDFRKNVQNLAEKLRQAYKKTWKVFLRSGSFMYRGPQTLDKIHRKARNAKIESSITSLNTLLSEVKELRELHEGADEALEQAHTEVNQLTNDAKKKSGQNLKEVKNLEQGWTMKQKIGFYGASLMVGAFTGNYAVAVASLTGTFLKECVDNDSNNIQKEKFAAVSRHFYDAYRALNHTRSVLGRDIQTLSKIGTHLEILIKSVEDVGIILTTKDMEELTDVVDRAKQEFKRMFEEYEQIIQQGTTAQNGELEETLD